ncbi:unnamed protein product [Bursaphelenchus okinawaensis]|uniref:Uncharacterized protein n=1 Tax=Bursaphelenchus okinawaensis TaxID=465554 RepID=A0A811K2I7_9BILA|nr:unnamed protein product [Bursaphelenchus okinawaensis]CAG9090727.1 unnamed protein product [Bursaphelenchus okinawaensis]
MALPLVDNIFMNRYSTETGRRFSTEGATRPKSYMGYIPTQDLDKLHIQRGDVKTLLERGYNGLGRVNGSKTEGRGQHNGGKDGIVSENRLQNGEEGSCEAEKRLQNETKRYMENRLQNEDHSNDIGQRMLYRTEHSNTDGQRMLQKIEHSNDTEKRQHKEVTYTPSNNTKMHNNKNPILQTPNLPHTQHPFPDNTAETTPEYTVRLRRELQPKNAETEAKSFVKPREPSRKESTGYARPHSFIDNIGCYTFQNNYRFINGTPKADPSSTVFSAQPCDTASLGKVNTGGFDKRCAGLKGGVGTDLLVKDSTSSPVKPITKSFGKTATSFTEKPTTNSSVKPITTSAVKATTTYSYRPNIDYPILETTTSYSTGLQSRLEAKKGLSTVTQSKLEDTPVLSDLPQSRKESIEAFCYKNQDRQESVKEGYKTCHFDPTVNSAYQKAATGSTTFETPLLIKNASTTSSKSVPVGSDLSFSTNFSTNSTDFSTNLTNYSTNPSVPTLPSKPISINFLSDSKDSEVSTQNITTGFPQFSTKSPQHLQDTLLRNHDARDAPRRPFSCFDMILLNTMKPAIEVTSLSSGTLIDSKGSSSSNSCLSLVSEESGCDDIVLGDVEDTDVVSGISNNRRLEEKSTSDLCMPEKARFDWKDNSTSQFKPTETTKDRLKPEENSQEALRQSKSLSTVYTKPAGPASDEKRKLWHEHAKRFQSCTGSSDLQSSDKAFRKLSADGDKAFRVLVDPEAECYEQPRSFSNFESCRSSQSPRPRMVRGMNAVTLDRRIKKAPFKSPALSERNFQSPDGMRTEAKKNKILRRHSNHQTRVSGASPGM